MKRLVVACILTALLLSGCAQPVIPQPTFSQPTDSQTTDTQPAKTQSTDPQPAPATSVDPSDGINDEEARAIAIEHAGLSADQVVFVKSDLDRDDGRKIYDVEFYTSDFKEYDYEIDPDTGEILNFDSDAEYDIPRANNTASPEAPRNGDGSRITEDEARAIAIAEVPGATLSDIREFETDNDDGRLEYEGTIVYDRMEYEFTIDAETGEIRSWEEESIFD